MQLTENFTREEFDSKDGQIVPQELLGNVRALAQNLEIIRKELGNRKIYINSGYRSFTHNLKIGGVPNSQHRLGKAADFVVQGMSPNQVYQVLERLIQQGRIKEGGLGLYDNFVHYDIRGKRSRWNFQKKK